MRIYYDEKEKENIIVRNAVKKMDKTSFILGILAGIIIGFLVSGLLFIFGLYEFGNSLQVAAVNTTINIPFNSTEFAEAMIENMNQTGSFYNE